MTDDLSRVHLADPDATDALGAAFADAWRTLHMPRSVVYLRGDLGAGKSTLARALLRALGVQGAIRSPTYTLVERYLLPRDGSAGGMQGQADEALHIDLYRIAGAGELEYLGLGDSEAVLWLVEWPERGDGALPPADLEIAMSLEGDGRSAGLCAGSDTGRALLLRLADGRLQPVSSVT